MAVLDRKKFFKIVFFGFVVLLITNGVSLSKLNMKKNDINNEAVTSFYNGETTEFYLASLKPPDNILRTTEFFERRPDLGEIQFLKNISWDIKVSPEAKLFIGKSGLSKDQLKTFWTGWFDDNNYYALSLYQENPIKVELGNNISLISPPVITANKKLNQFFWKDNNGKWTLCKFEFSGEFQKKGEVKTIDLFDLNNKPLLSKTAPLIGSEKNEIVVSWVSIIEDSIKVFAQYFSDDSSKPVSAFGIPDLVPVENQRLSLISASEELNGVGLLTKNENGNYIYLRYDFNFKTSKYDLQTFQIDLTPNSIISAQTFFYNDEEELSGFMCVVNKENKLIFIKPKTGFKRIIRDNVEPDYNYPILTSSGASYEAVKNKNNDLELVPFN